MYVDPRTLKRVISQRDEILDWLKTNAAFAADEQKQLDGDSPERAYWHFGYQAALTDMINLLAEKRSTDSVGTLN